MLAALPPNSPRDVDERRIGNVEIRPAELQVLIDGRRAGLTVREFELFYVLAERLDRVVQRSFSYSGIKTFPLQDIAMMEDQWGPVADRTR